MYYDEAGDSEYAVNIEKNTVVLMSEQAIDNLGLRCKARLLLDCFLCLPYDSTLHQHFVS